MQEAPNRVQECSNVKSQIRTSGKKNKTKICNFNVTKALSCVLTVKLPFSHVEKVDIMAPLLCSTSETL